MERARRRSRISIERERFGHLVDFGETPAASTLSPARKKAHLDYAPLSDQPLAFQIVVGLLVVHVPVRVLVLLVHLLVPAPGALALEGLVQRQRFGDGRDLRVREKTVRSAKRALASFGLFVSRPRRLF